jgi:uncharacterized protein YneR
MLCPQASAQSIISAQSGAVHYIEGEVRIDGVPVRMDSSRFPAVAQGSVLSTHLGRAELLLTPGMFLRLPESSSMRMLRNALTDTHIELLSGSALIEAVDVFKGNSVAMHMDDVTVTLQDKGLYYFESDPARLSVYKGKAEVARDGEVLTVKGGRQASLGGRLVAVKFDTKQADGLYRWSAQRSSYVAMASYPTAQSIYQRGYDWTTSGWMWSPYYGMFTYIPGSGRFVSPFGYSFYSPRMLYFISAPPQPVQVGGGGGPQWSAERGYSVTSVRSEPVATGSASVNTTAVSDAPSSARSAGTEAPSRSAGGGGR